MSSPPDNKTAGKTKKRLFLFIIISVSVVAATCLGLLGEVMPEVIQSGLQKYFNEKKEIWITAVSLLAISGIVITFWLTKMDEKKEKEPVSLTDEQRQQFIKLLQNRYALRLTQKTGERFALKLELRYTLDGIQQTERLDITARQTGRPIGGLANLVKRHRYLLLMGQPGAGKTTLLLSTAEELLQQAMADKDEPIPVIFNLASWRETESSFDGWMAKILIHGYGYPPASASEAVNKGRVMLLLDGLDEVGSNLENKVHRNKLRQNCLDAIQQYQVQRRSPTGMIICTRIDEYLSAGGNAPVYAQLLLQPIDKTELQACLKSIARGEEQSANEEKPYQAANRAAATNLMQLTANSANLEELLCTPFYFNAALRVLNKPGDGSISFVHDMELCKQKLEALYVKRTMNDEQHKAYSYENLNHWLAWLANWQSQRSSASFELSSFGVKSLSLTNRQQKQYSVTGSLVSGLLGSLISGLSACLVGSLLWSLIYSLIFGWYFGWTYNLFGFERRMEIRTLDIARFNIKVMTYRILLFILIYSVILGLLVGRYGGLYLGLVFGLVIGLVMSLTFGLIKGLSRGLGTEYFTEITYPTQRLFAGIRLFWLLVFSPLVAIFAFSLWWKPALIVKILMPSIPVMIGLIFMLRSIPLIKFISVKFTLSRLGHLPFRMSRFFDYCANELHLLEKDTGGSWRFRHQIIQDYFVEQYRSRQVQVS